MTRGVMKKLITTEDGQQYLISRPAYHLDKDPEEMTNEEFEEYEDERKHQAYLRNPHLTGRI